MTITRDDPRFWDVRTLERRLRKGLISKKDYDKYLKALPDVENKKGSVAIDDEVAPPPGSNGVHSDSE